MDENGADGGRTIRRQSVEIAVALGISTTIGYGTLYYAFGVLAREMAADTGLSVTMVFGLFSLGMFASGLVAVRAGSLFDRYDPARVMSAGSLGAALLLALWAGLPGKAAFALLLVAIQAVSMLLLYEAAFVAAATYVPGAARRTITGITLIAGFASTIFWPLTAWLQSHWSWREIQLLFALLHVVFGLLPHLWLARRTAGNLRRDQPRAASPQSDSAIAGERNRKAALFLMLFGFATNAFIIASIHLHLIGILNAVGLATSAALIGALLGPSQVAGRFIEFVLADRLSILAVTIFSALALPAALAILVATAPWATGAVLFAVLFGLGQGLSYIARGILPLEMLGSREFGRLTGRINAGRLYASAAAPFVTAAFFERTDATTTVLALMAVGFASVAAFVAIVPALKRAPAEQVPPPPG